MNKQTTNSYFLAEKFQGSEIRPWKFGGGLIFGPRIFLVSSGIRQVCNSKTAWKKIEIVCSFSGIPITCRLEMEYFFTQIRNHAVCRVYVTQSRLTRLFHMTCVMSSKREFRKDTS